MPSMRPPFVSEELAATIFKAGKCIHFLRECCDDREWTLSRGAGGDDDWAAPLVQGKVGQGAAVCCDGVDLVVVVVGVARCSYVRMRIDSIVGGVLDVQC